MTPVQIIEGVVESVDGASEGPSRDRTYTVLWTMLDGGTMRIAGCGTREAKANDPMERVAFPIGFTVVGVLRGGLDAPSIYIMDREDYAVGC